MSHWRKFNSEVLVDVKGTLLAKAAEDLGLRLDTNVKSIKNAYGTDKVDAGFVKNGRTISLGIQYEKGEDNKTRAYIRGDFWATGIREDDFTNRLSQAYQKYRIVDICENEGWSLDSVKTNNNGEIEVELFQYA